MLEDFEAYLYSMCVQGLSPMQDHELSWLALFVCEHIDDIFPPLLFHVGQ